MRQDCNRPTGDPPDPLTFDTSDPLGLALQPWCFDPTTPADQGHNGGITPGYAKPLNDADPATVGTVRELVREEMGRQLGDALGRLTAGTITRAEFNRAVAELADEVVRVESLLSGRW